MAFFWNVLFKRPKVCIYIYCEVEDKIKLIRVHTMVFTGLKYVLLKILRNIDIAIRSVISSKAESGAHGLIIVPDSVGGYSLFVWFVCMFVCFL